MSRFVFKFLFLFLTTSLLVAFDKDALKTQVGVVGMSVPRFKGSQDQQMRLFPFLSWRYKDHLSFAFNGLSYEHKPLSFLTSSYQLSFDFGQKAKKGLRRSQSILPKFVLSQRFKWRYAFLDLGMDNYFSYLSSYQGYRLTLGHGLYVPWIKVFGSLSYQREWLPYAYLTRFYALEEDDRFSSYAMPLHAEAWSLTLIKPINDRLTLVMPFTFKSLSSFVQRYFVLESRYQRSVLMIFSYQL